MVPVDQTEKADQNDQFDQIEDNFLSALNILLKEYSSYDENENVAKLIKVFNKLDYKKLAKKIHDRVGDKKNLMKTKDETVFNENFLLLPGVDISNVWNKLSDKKKNKFFISLYLILSYSEMIVTHKEIKDKMKDAGLNFNPFEGVKGGDIDTDGIKNTIGEIKVAGDGVGRVMSLMKGQLGDLDKLTEQLKNMSDDDIENATKTVKDLFGNNSSDMEEMLKVIAAELKTGKSVGGNDDIMSRLNSIAESVAAKMTPKLDSGEVDGDKLFESTQQLMNKMIPEKDAKNLMKQFENHINNNNNKK